MEEIRTIKDAMEHLEQVASEDPYNGGSICSYTGKDLADVAYIFLDEGHWGNLQPLSERDVMALTIMRNCLSQKIR